MVGLADDITAQVLALDGAGATDREYRKILSTGSRRALKPGETWRGRALQWAEHEAASEVGPRPRARTKLAIHLRCEWDRARELERDAAQVRARAVHAALQTGWGYAAVAEALGISRQAVRKLHLRYAGRQQPPTLAELAPDNPPLSRSKGAR